MPVLGGQEDQLGAHSPSPQGFCKAGAGILPAKSSPMWRFFLLHFDYACLIFGAGSDSPKIMTLCVCREGSGGYAVPTKSESAHEDMQSQKVQGLNKTENKMDPNLN